MKTVCRSFFIFLGGTSNKFEKIMNPPPFPPTPTPRGKGGFDIVKIFDDPKVYVLKNIFLKFFFW